MLLLMLILMLLLMLMLMLMIDSLIEIKKAEHSLCALPFLVVLLR